MSSELISCIIEESWIDSDWSCCFPPTNEPASIVNRLIKIFVSYPSGNRHRIWRFPCKACSAHSLLPLAEVWPGRAPPASPHVLPAAPWPWHPSSAPLPMSPLLISAVNLWASRVSVCQNSKSRSWLTPPQSTSCYYPKADWYLLFTKQSVYQVPCWSSLATWSSRQRLLDPTSATSIPTYNILPTEGSLFWCHSTRRHGSCWASPQQQTFLLSLAESSRHSKNDHRDGNGSGKWTHQNLCSIVDSSPCSAFRLPWGSDRC